MGWEGVKGLCTSTFMESVIPDGNFAAKCSLPHYLKYALRGRGDPKKVFLITFCTLVIMVTNQ